MSIKDTIKRNKLIMSVYHRLSEWKYEIATVISPRLNTKMRYKSVFGEKWDCKFPSTFNQKLLWLKINNYNKNVLVKQCADKYKVRDYVKQCGCSDTLNELIAVYENTKEIEWDKLPNRFVIKLNIGCGFNIVVRDKSSLDYSETTKRLKRWMKSKYHLAYSEMQYKGVKPYIIVEKYLENPEESTLTDYKVYCFHGEPLAILVMHDRNACMKTEFFDRDWQRLKNTNKYLETDVPTAKPVCFQQMMDVSRALSSPFPFVRCDFYVVSNKLIFGELTFTPAGGLGTSQTLINGKDMSHYLRIEDD